MSLFGQIEAIVDRIIGRRIDYCHPWAGTISSQSGNTVDFVPDNERLPHLIGVPIRTGVAGVRVTVASGARARAFFDDGDPSKPYVALWDIGTITSIDLADAGGQPIARQGDLVIVSIPSTQILASVAAMALNTDLATGIVRPAGPGAPIQGVGYISSGSAKVRSI